MGINTVIGKKQWSVVGGQLSVKTKTRSQSEIQNPKSKIEKGFSLLELMISMFIVIILLSVAIPTYERSVRQARETVLKENLWQMRRAIDQFNADKGKLPQSVDELVSEKYLREKPIDPVSEKTEWKEIQGEDTNSSDATQGLKDVQSTAEGEDSNGTSYSKY